MIEQDKLAEAQVRMSQLRRRGIGFAYSVLRDFHAAEDVYQESCVVVIRRIDEYTGDGFDTWFWTILRNVIGTQLRSLSRRRVTADSSLLDRIGRRFLAAEPDVEEMNQLLECVKKLPEKARSVLEWRFMDDTQCDEIAARCGRSVQSVYAQIKRAKEMLRECVKTSAMSWSGTE